MQTATKYFKTKFYEIKYFSLNLIYSNKRKNLFDVKRYTKQTDIDAYPVLYALKS